MRLAALSTLLITVGAATLRQESIEYWNSVGRDCLNSKLKSDFGKVLAEQQTPPKNVILFIGDGMGIATITAARIARNQGRGSADTNIPFFFETFPFSGLSKTASFDTHTTDSAASAVALMTGHKVEQNTLGRIPGNGNKCENGEKAKIRDGIADLALEKGLEVGFATTSSITDATPGALYAKDVHRRMEFDSAPGMNGTSCEDVASQILNHPADKFRVMMGGGHAQFLSEVVGGNRTDNRSIEEEWTQITPALKSHSRVLLASNEEFVRHEPKEGEQLLGIFSPLHFPYRVDENLANRSSVPRLSEMAVKAVQMMNKQSNNKGYFLMIEGANIDKAQHKNKFHLAAEELNEFDRAIKQVSEMVGDDTLIIVTADHAHALTIPGYLNKTESIFERDGNVTSIFFATGPGFGDGNKTNYTKEEAKDPHFSQPSSIYFKDARHGGEDVGIWAKGPFAWLFTGTIENTQIAYNIKYLLCLDDKEDSICDLRSSMAEKKENEETEKRLHKTTQSTQTESLHILNTDLPMRGMVIALLVITCVLAVLVAVLLVLLLRSSFRGSVKPSDSSS
ncbi:hypothetical protein PFISCL1PPCAC_16509 [Pristionchus fissidentatus]|uniref:alkaline phosphatase n=1 Tax=Pristionchus fissidentatus TaxID=1538716 RepID=A0AAV5W559_9BILA|nr:hypothetical protein PFISCL1PPCAC_16509 [Pristionchus fissidentatus]